MRSTSRHERSGLVRVSLSFLVSVTAFLAVASGCPADQPGAPDGGQDSPDGGTTARSDEVEARLAPIDDGNLDSSYVLDATGSLNPSGRVLVYVWEVDAPEGDGCEGTIGDVAAPLTTFTPTCRGVHRVTLTVALVDGSRSSKAEESFAVDNRAPVLSGLEQDRAFLPGVDVTIFATVTDADDDATTCTARLADDNTGDPAGFVVPAAPSSDCSFTITTPGRVDTWKVVVVANDGFEDSLPMTIELTPGNDPPVLEGLVPDVADVGYTCVDAACAAAAVRVTVTATDDSDDFEDLVITLTDVTTGAPAGALVDITAVDGTHGAFDVLVSREDLGALLGTYTVEASVTEVTSDGTPASVTQQVSFDVTGEAPVIDTLTADDVGHTYDAGASLFRATVTVTVSSSDPEDNALTEVIELVSCPTAAFGEAACGGAALTVEETPGGGELVVALSSADLSKLAGDYTFRVTVTDPDGLSVVEETVVAVLNSPPALATGFPGSAEQSYTGSAHAVTVPFLYDPDGDPFTATLSALCPDGSTVASLPGSCSSGQSVTVTAAGLLTVSGPASGLLGNYRVQGNVSDGALVGPIDATLTVTNTAPTLTRTSVALKMCNHTTSGTTVKNESGCVFPFEATAADANGDPLIKNRALVPSGGYTSTDVALTDSPVPDSGVISINAGIETSYANFKSTFATQTQRLVVTVEDPFGAIAQAGMDPRLMNRAPTVPTKVFRNTTETGSPPPLHNEEIAFVFPSSGEARAENCSTCAYPPTYRFAVRAYVSDADGDPVQIELDIDCADAVTLYPNGDPSQPVALGGGVTSHVYQLEIDGTAGTCGTGTFPPRERAWTVNAFRFCTLNGCGDPAYGFGCTLQGDTSVITDGLANNSWGVDLSLDFGLADTTTPFTCTN